MFKKFLSLALYLTLTLLIFIGCSAAKKPLAPAENQTPEQGMALNGGLTSRQETANKQAIKVRQEISILPEVVDSTVVINNKRVYIGLNLEDGIKGNNIHAVERKVINRVKNNNNNITNVYVSSNQDTVNRLKKIHKEVNDGTPVNNFAEELGEMERRVTPIM